MARKREPGQAPINAYIDIHILRVYNSATAQSKPSLYVLIIALWGKVVPETRSVRSCHSTFDVYQNQTSDQCCSVSNCFPARPLSTGIRPSRDRFYRVPTISRSHVHSHHGTLSPALPSDSAASTQFDESGHWSSGMPDVHSTDRLIALFIAALCSGVYICTLLLSLRWLVFRDEGWSIRKRINKGFLAATLTIAVLATIHTVLAVTTSVAKIREVESATPSTKPDEKVPWESVVMVSCNRHLPKPLKEHTGIPISYSVLWLMRLCWWSMVSWWVVQIDTDTQVFILWSFI